MGSKQQHLQQALSPQQQRWTAVTRSLGSIIVIAGLIGCTPRQTSTPSSTSTPPVTDQSVQTTAAPESPPRLEANNIEPNDSEANDSGTDESIWSQLQQPEQAYFILMRHALAPGTGDPEIFQLGECSTQRNLSAEGREQARRTGEAFRQRGVAVAQVLSSEWCRCLETAELMNLAAVVSFAPINSFFRDRSTEAAQTEQVEQFMLSNAEASGVTIMVTHFVNIAALSGSGVGSGEMVVMRVDENKQQLEVVGALAEPF